MKLLPAIAIALIAFLSASRAIAQGVPLAISYQAALTDDAGDPLSPGTPTNYPVIFRIYDAVEDGALLWAETQNVSVFAGSFSTLLGTGDEIDGEPYPQLDTIFDDSLRYLEVTIEEGGSEKTFVPRQRMVSSPFAFRAKVAEQALSVADSVVSTNQIANGSVTAAKLDANSVSAAALQSNSVGSAQIASNAVGSSEIASGAIDMDELSAAVVNRLIPAGTVVAWAGRKTPGAFNNGLPPGWLLCDGSAVPISSYPALWAAIGPIYGYNGANFYLPDYRGYFLRGQGENTTHDPDLNSRAGASVYSGYGDGVGSSQADEFHRHNHNDGSYNRVLRVTGGLTTDGVDNSSGEPDIVTTRAMLDAGGNETRPKNRSVWYIIKAH